MTPTLSVTPIYAALIAGIFIALSARVITYRRSRQLGLGDHGDKSLLKRMRAQANCAEYAPFGLLLLALAELQGVSTPLLHLLGLSLLAGRALHAYGFSASPPIQRLRVLGMTFTFVQITVTALVCLVMALFQ